MKARNGAAARALLVSIHDVSPLTLEASRRAVDLAVSAGIPRAALTLLVIPRHEDRAPLDDSPETCRWVRGLAEDGADLCMHGFTHRMTGRARDPWRWAWASGFARGQGELYLCGAAECHRRLRLGRDILRRAGLGAHVSGFVPPAWLVSGPSLGQVERAGFAFHERLAGIVHAGRTHARRLIGFGSLTAFEAGITALHAQIQARRPAADTRFAIHPADLERPTTVRAIRATLDRLVGPLTPMNYSDFLEVSGRQAKPWERPATG